MHTKAVIPIIEIISRRIPTIITNINLKNATSISKPINRIAISVEISHLVDSFI